MTSQARRHQKTGSAAKGSEDDTKGIWSSLLDSVATGKRLAEKNLLILGMTPPGVFKKTCLMYNVGGTTASQNDFLDVLADENAQTRRGFDRSQSKRPPVANRFALGYTYQDVLDVDHDGRPLAHRKLVTISRLLLNQTSLLACRYTYYQTAIPPSPDFLNLSSHHRLYRIC